MVRGKSDRTEIEEYVAPKPPAVPVQMPSVGRIVHYMRYWNRDLVPMAAVIIKVWDSNPQMVNLKYWDCNGAEFFAANVLPPETIPGDILTETDTANRWVWPPRV